MSRINTNISSLIAQRVLGKNNNNLNTSLQRLSTGVKINSGADDPAGLIASENLKAEQKGISTAIDNAGRANNIIGTADGGLGEVSSLLNELQGLVGQAANSGALSTEELSANQLQVDSVLSTINRIAGSTTFEGKKLLDGSFAYQTGSLDTTKVGNVQINSAHLIAGASKAVVVDVTQSAQTAQVVYSTGNLTDNVTVEVGGNLGTTQISLTTGSTNANIATAINGAKGVTGVSAIASTDSKLYVNSTEFGSKQFVSLTTISGTFVPDTETGNTIKSVGRDATVKVNGAAAQAEGLNVSYRSSDLDLQLSLKNVALVNVTNGTTSFNITGGGANFSLGSKVTEDGQASIGIQSVSTGNLGTGSTFLSSLGSGLANNLTSNNLVAAQKIVDGAIKQVSQLRGRLGAFQKFTIGSTVNSLGVAYENASSAESAINDTDFAKETSNLTRSQILSSAASTVLAQANSQPQAALALLRGG